MAIASPNGSPQIFAQFIRMLPSFLGPSHSDRRLRYPATIGYRV